MPARDAVTASSRLVQLGTDSPRTVRVDDAPRKHERLELGTLEPGVTSGELAAALAACLHRYTAQAEVALDMLLPRAGTSGATSTRLVALDLALAPDTTFASSATQLSADFAREHVVPPVAANVVLCWDVTNDAALARYELCFVAAAGALTATYDAELFLRDTVARIGESLLALLSAARVAPSTPIAQLPVLSAADRHAIETTWDSGTAADYPQLPVVRVFQALAAAHPHDVAVVHEQVQLDYAELDARSSRLARHLLQRGVSPGTPVAICVEPSVDILIAMLALFKVGGLYVPLDPTHPEKLIANMLDDAQPKLVLTQSRVRALVQPQRFDTLCLDTDAALWESLDASAPDVSLELDQPAYLFFTSGTTGKPKGVLGTQRNLAHYVHSGIQQCGFRRGDSFVSLARYTFTISLFELLIPLCCGGRTRLLARDHVLAPQRLAQTLRDVTVLHAGPSLLGNLLRHIASDPSAPQTFPALRHLSTGGDIVPPHLLEQLMPVLPNAELFVIYGCTETTPMSAIYAVDRTHKQTRSFVGRAFPDVAVRVLDSHGQLAPIGAVGEICFSGKGLAREYLNRPELSAEKFVQREGRRYYHTGDMGRLHADGNLEILGRRDFQVQLRGIRIELAGIENMVRELGLAVQCAVVVKSLDEQDQRLVAFLVKPRETNPAAFRRELAAHLPSYMLPQSMVAIDALPLTVNGKLDRRALQELPWQAPIASASPQAAALDALEHAVIEAFAHALQVPDVGLDDDFFDLGGHSLLAVRVMQALENALGVTLPPGVLFERPTARALVEGIKGAGRSETRPILLNAGDGPPFFLVSGVHIYRDLAKGMESRFAVYGVYSQRELSIFDAGQQRDFVVELATEYCQIIRRLQPSGPYRLAGLSFGGVVAYEVALQLTAAGERVTFLGLLDTTLPIADLRSKVERVVRLAMLPVRTLAGEVMRRVRTRVAAHSPTGAPQDTQVGISTMEQRRDHLYRQAVAHYTRRSQWFAGSATLIVANQRKAAELAPSPDGGWERRVRSLTQHSLACGHLDVVKAPYADEVARVFLAALGNG